MTAGGGNGPAKASVLSMTPTSALLGSVVHRRHKAGRAGRKRGRLRPLAVRRIEDEPCAARVGAIAGAEPVDVGDGEGGVDHAQWLEHTVAQYDVERLAGGACDEYAEHV